MFNFLISSFFIVLISTILYFGLNAIIKIYNLFLFYIGIYDILIYYISILSLVSFLVSLILIPILISKMPCDYFLLQRKNSIKKFSFFKSFLGLILILLGLIMLITPGQGIITIFIGLLFLDFPKRYEIEMSMLKKFNLLKHLNWVRKKFGKREFVLN